MTVENTTGSAAYPASVDLQVVYILDITGSMGSQLDGVKSMISKFCENEQEGIDIHIWTFTENSSKCYVSTSPYGLKGQELISYVNSIKLNTPPDFPKVAAYGEDGPENSVSAVVNLTHCFSIKHNIVAFLITDNEPHYKKFNLSSTSTCEKQWLKEKGHIEHDSFILLNEVIESLNVTIVPILYCSAEASIWYQQAAYASDGVILLPSSSDSTVLANSLTAILEALQSVSTNRYLHASTSLGDRCRGFKIGLIPEDFITLECEPNNATELKSQIAHSNSAETVTAGLIGLLQTTVERFGGKRAGKRCTSADTIVIRLSVKILVLTMIYISGNSPEVNYESILEVINELKDYLTIKTSATSAYEIKLLDSFLTLDQLNDSRLKLSQGEVSDTTCVISLMSTLEHLNSLEVPRSVEDIQKWMEMVLESVMCRFIDVSFPKDMFGNPDFMDAWSSVILDHSLSTWISASAAMKLRDEEGFYLDPLTRKQYNTALIVAHPNDTGLSLVYKVLSSLPTLQGLIQGYLASGGMKVFPSLNVGLQAGTLLRITNNSAIGCSLNEAEWNFSRQIINSLQISMGSIAKDVIHDLKNKSQFNPADSLTKLVTGLIRYKKFNPLSDELSHNLLKALFDEMSGSFAAMIERLRKNPDYECDLPCNLDILELVVNTNVDGFDPTEMKHDIELALEDDSYWIPETGFKSVGQLFGKTKVFKKLVHSWTVLVDCLFTDVQKPSMDDLGTHNPLSIDVMQQSFTESIILKKRTGRYSLEGEVWNRLDEKEVYKQMSDQCKKFLLDEFRSNIENWNEARASHAKNQLLDEVSKFAAEHAEGYNKLLSECQMVLLGKTYKLSRMDAIPMLERVGTEKILTLGREIVLGSWTSEPPSQLRRYITDISPFFSALPEIQKEIKKYCSGQAFATRELPNRHGHSISLQYPGPCGWTPEYDAAVSGGSGKARTKQFTLYALKFHNKLNGVITTNQEKLINFTIGCFTSPHIETLTAIVNLIKANPAINKPRLNTFIDDEIKRIPRLNKQPRRISAMVQRIK